MAGTDDASDALMTTEARAFERRLPKGLRRESDIRVKQLATRGTEGPVSGAFLAGTAIAQVGTQPCDEIG